MSTRQNEGARLTGIELDKRGIQQKQLASDMDAEESQVSRWLNSKARPKTAQRMWLQERLGVPWDSWDRDAAEPATDSPPASTPTPGSGEHAAVEPPSSTGTDGMGG